ncbi:MAG: chorismate mutase [Candidatus Shikimatogenerans sp. Ttur]|uniref:chorismate mutase n=1 Tax=Candidatus Shikimatogenerans sp. Ttur TaxID=3158569 RepID=A0AAU7ZXI7_9FLAO
MILNIKKKNNNIPIIFDPSHIAGNNIYIYNLLKKSKIFNYNGYIIESHIKPKKALSDNLQQLKPKIIKKYINKIFYNNNNNNNNNNKLKIKRLEIDEIDKKIIFNIYNRCLIINKIKKIKKIHNINIIQKKRYKKIFKIYKKYSYLLKIPYILKIFKIIYKLSIFLQKGIIKL